MAATRIVSGTLREVWRESVALDGGASETITTGIAAYNLARVDGTLYVTAASGSPRITATPSIVSNRLVVTVANTASAGNAATFDLHVE